MVFASTISSAALIKFFMLYASFLIRLIIFATASCIVSSRMIQKPALAGSVSGYRQEYMIKQPMTAKTRNSAFFVLFARISSLLNLALRSFVMTGPQQ